MSPQPQPLEINDFSGGFTDNYVDAPMNCYQKADNFFITTNRKLLSRPGSKVNDLTYFQSPQGTKRLGTLINYDKDSTLLQHVGQKIYFVNGSGFQDLLGPTGNSVFQVQSFTAKVAHAQWNKHLFVTNDLYSSVMKIYRDNTSTLRVRTAGLPDLATPPVVTAGAAGANSYLYRFIYHYTYFVDTVENQDFGPTTEVTLTAAAAPNINTVAITAIPVLANGATQNWDTTVIKVKIYRTVNNGTSFFFVGEVTNGTTTFNDTVADTALILAEQLYTNGGTVDNDPPPLCKYLHVADGKAWYLGIKEGTEEFGYRVRQSVQDDLDSCPVDFFVDVEDEGRGISSVRGIPIILCKKFIYRLDGSFDEQGRGGITYQKINDTAGCVSHNSIVQTIEGIFWAGNDGFYYSDGYKAQKISNGFNDTYKTLVGNETQKGNIVGTYDEENNRIIWAVQTDGSSLDNDSWFILDLKWGIRPESSFTTCSGGDSFAPSSLVVFNKKIMRGDKRGYLFIHDDETFTDPKVDIFKVPSAWGYNTVIWDYRSASMSFGSTFVRKWGYKILTTAKNKTDLSLQIISNNDDNRQVIPLFPIRFRGNVLWGDIEPVWGDPLCVWNKQGLIDELRRFPQKTLRFDFKQIQMTNAFVNITKSDTLGAATSVAGVTPFDSNLNYITLNDTVNFDWPLESVGYFMAFENDNYVMEYPVAVRTADMLTIVDADSVAPVGVVNWVLRGKPKNEVFNLLSYVVHYIAQSDTQNAANTANNGKNA